MRKTDSVIYFVLIKHKSAMMKCYTGYICVLLNSYVRHIQWCKGICKWTIERWWSHEIEVSMNWVSVCIKVSENSFAPRALWGGGGEHLWSWKLSAARPQICWWISQPWPWTFPLFQLQGIAVSHLQTDTLSYPLAVETHQAKEKSPDFAICII